MINVSVIIPVYKTPLDCLNTCLRSLVAQDMSKSEFVVVLDGASDDAYSVCEEYAVKDARFKIFRNAHLGVSATRNFGISNAHGEYIAFVDSDDWIDANTLQECFDFAKKFNSDIVTMDFFENKKGMDILRKQQPKSTDAQKMLRQILVGELFGGMPIRMIKMDFYKKHPTLFPTNVGYCEDVAFWAQFLQFQPQINYLNKAFYHYVQDNKDSITRKYTVEKYIERKKSIQVLKKILPNTFDSEINMAAFNVKMEAMKYGLLSSKDYMSFEKTYLKNLFFSNQTLRRRAYLLFITIYTAIFKKAFKEFL